MSIELNNLRKKLKNMRGTAPQFLDVKHRNDLVSYYRDSLRKLINECRDLEEARDHSSDSLDQTYLAYDILFVKKQIKERFMHYRTVMRDAMEMYDIYAECLKSGKIQYKNIRTPKSAVNSNKKAA